MNTDEIREILRADVVAGAKRLLGCTIVWSEGRARIVETEAYRGNDDPGCHAFGRPLMKNMALYGPPGTAYIYRSYGIHQMLNVVALPEGQAGGILIRALRRFLPDGSPSPDFSSLSLKGPGRLAKTLGIDPTANGRDAFDGSASFLIVPGPPVEEILSGPRIGLSIGKGESTPWRFVTAEDRRWASATPRGLSPIEKTCLSP